MLLSWEGDSPELVVAGLALPTGVVLTELMRDRQACHTHPQNPWPGAKTCLTGACHQTPSR